MAEIHMFTGSRVPAKPARAANPVDLANEAIRRGVQYLAFRAHPLGLDASYAPGSGHVNGMVARAAQAAVKAHQELASNLEVEAPSPARSAAIAARRRFARQLAEVKAGVTRTPTTALRSIYLDALAELMVETIRNHGARVLEAWASGSHSAIVASTTSPGQAS